MELKTLTTSPPKQQQQLHHRHLTPLRRRGIPLSTKACLVFVVLVCTLFGLATCDSSGNGLQKLLGNDECASYGDKFDAPADGFLGGTPSGSGTQRVHFNSESVCTSSLSFCFPSTLPGFLEHKLKLTDSEVSGSQSDDISSIESTENSNVASNKSWSSDNGMFKLFNGGIVTCSLISKEATNEFSSIQTDSANQNDLSSCRGPLLYQKSTSYGSEKTTEMTKSKSFGGSSSPHVEITPAVLDWGHKYMYFPSLIFLTVANTCNDSILHVYEPFSTDIQFYACNFSEAVLGPGEVASICFVFLPRWLGPSSAHIILQTSSGGFLIQAKGFSTESPYGMHPLSSVDVFSKGRWIKNLSLFNSFDQHFHVEEVTARILVSLDHTSHYAEAACRIRRDQGLGVLNVKDRLFVSTGHVGLPLLAMRPFRNWDIGPHSSETIIEIDFSVESRGKIFGAICMQLLRSSQDKSDTIVLPFEAEVDGMAMIDDLEGPIIASLQVLHPWAGNDAVVAISLKNCAPYVLRVLEVTEIAESKIFQMKQNEGLLLFPGTDTYVAIVKCTHLHVEDARCKLIILTNDSSSSPIEVPCEDVVQICSSLWKDSTVGYEDQSERSDSGDLKILFSDSSKQLPSATMAIDTAGEADELVLRNWKSHDTGSGMSVLDDDEVLFPLLQVGSHYSKWINVNNPSQEPVVMQLILNSGEIIDQCKSSDGFIQPPSSGSLVSNKSPSPNRFGFSIAESALTEAYVLPNGRASLGPLVFKPSSRCEWRSSALIRNNLSGVEWLPLRGMGGSLSLLLVEESEPIQGVEFNLSLPLLLNISYPDMLLHVEDKTLSCLQPLSKELYAKNTGDLPLEVTKMKVSGKECNLDGFMVQPCKGFSLQPGESAKLLISYQTDFLAPLIQRDLELALKTGILVIPMKASLPLYMLNTCRTTSVFWMRIKKYAGSVFFVGSVMFLVLWYIFSQVFVLSSNDCLCTSISSLDTSTSVGRKPCDVHSCKLPVSSEINSLLTYLPEDRSLMQASVGGYTRNQAVTIDLERKKEEGKKSDHRAKKILEAPKQTHDLSGTPKNKGIAFSLMSESDLLENPDKLEASELGNLTIKTGKELGRRRRKRKSTGSKLAGLLELSSSQSGNSTPSSPLSPVTFVSPKQTGQLSPDVGQAVVATNPFTHAAHQRCQKSHVFKTASKENLLEPGVSMKYCISRTTSSSQVQPSAPRNTLARPVLLPSATFPSAGRPAPIMVTSVISPHARAPGSKFYDRKNIRAEEKAQLKDEYTYDIWGDHFSRLVLGRSKDTNPRSSSNTESDPDSFFVKGPQILMTNCPPRSTNSSDVYHVGGNPVMVIVTLPCNHCSTTPHAISDGRIITTGAIQRNSGDGDGSQRMRARVRASPENASKGGR